mmetsp:Transcript_30979/g.100935  ORF Transcript_30979/g.100935 Transcript_30979/m.100935 type:complete len:216 (+) Transcript_30979:433-1080(+)
MHVWSRIRELPVQVRELIDGGPRRHDGDVRFEREPLAADPRILCIVKLRPFAIDYSHRGLVAHVQIIRRRWRLVEANDNVMAVNLGTVLGAQQISAAPHNGTSAPVPAQHFANLLPLRETLRIVRTGTRPVVASRAIIFTVIKDISETSRRRKRKVRDVHARRIVAIAARDTGREHPLSQFTYRGGCRLIHVFLLVVVVVVVIIARSLFVAAPHA